MSVPTLRLTQRPDHVVNKGDTILIGDDPYLVVSKAPVPAEVLIAILVILAILWLIGVRVNVG